VKVVATKTLAGLHSAVKKSALLKGFPSRQRLGADSIYEFLEGVSVIFTGIGLSISIHS